MWVNKSELYYTARRRKWSEIKYQKKYCDFLLTNCELIRLIRSIRLFVGRGEYHHGWKLQAKEMLRGKLHLETSPFH